MEKLIIEILTINMSRSHNCSMSVCPKRKMLRFNYTRSTIASLIGYHKPIEFNYTSC